MPDPTHSASNLSGPPIEPLRRGKVYEQVAGQLQRWIATQLKPGDKLPPERELTAMFGVGRSSIRDALQKLQLYGLVETRHGIGTVVCEPSGRGGAVLAEALSQPIAELAQLLDFRQMLEPALAARAALHATPEQVAALRQVVERQSAKLRAQLPAVEEDAEFHRSIALAAGNRVVQRVLDTVMSLIEPTRAEQFQSPERPARSLAGHRAILAAIARRDAEAAETAMRKHLSDVEAIIAHRVHETGALTKKKARSARGSS